MSNGLGMQRGTGGTFISTFRGNFTTKCDPKTPGSIARINKEGKEVTELHFNYFVGKVVSINKKDSPYGLVWEIGLHADKTYTLTLPFGGGMVVSLFSRLVNVDLSKEIYIGILENEGDDKKMRTFFYIYENPRQEGGRWVGEKAKPYWTKDEPNNLPGLVKIRRKGKEEFDDTERMEYVEAFLKENIIPNLPQIESDQDAGEAVHDDKPEPEVKKAPLPAWLQGKTVATGSGQAAAPVKAPAKPTKKPEPVLPDNDPTDDLPF